MGFFSENHQLTATNFNSYKLTSQNFLRTKKNELLFEYNNIFGFHMQYYYRNNLHFIDVICAIGGITSLILLGGRIIGNHYNNMYQTYLLVDEAHG